VAVLPVTNGLIELRMLRAGYYWLLHGQDILKLNFEAFDVSYILLLIVIGLHCFINEG
jgi:hypothetical protein